MRHIVPHPHGTFTDGELVFSTSAAVHILEVIQAAAKDAAMLRAVGDTQAEVWPTVYEPFH